MRPAPRCAAALTIASAVAALSGCASTRLPPVTSPDFALADDEKAIWAQAAEEQARLDASGDVYEDPALEAYLAGVVKKLAPRRALEVVPFRVKVLENFRLNAFALPNGAIYVNTGLLARMESEAELAAVLGHEMTHATHRHAARHQRDAQNWSGAMAGVSAATLGLASSLGGLAMAAAVSGYGRDLEREADREGLSMMAAAGYAVADAPKVFEHLEQWVKAEKLDEPFFFGSHPRLRERRQSCEELVRTVHAGAAAGERNAEPFRQRTSRAVLANARLALAGGRLEAARRDAEKHLAVEPRSAGGHAVMGEIARRAGDAGSLEASAGHFRRALDMQPRLGEAHRGLGLVLLKLGDRRGALSALSRYLELEPGAADRAHIRELLDRPGGKQP